MRYACPLGLCRSFLHCSVLCRDSALFPAWAPSPQHQFILIDHALEQSSLLRRLSSAVTHHHRAVEITAHPPHPRTDLTILADWHVPRPRHSATTINSAPVSFSVRCSEVTGDPRHRAAPSPPHRAIGASSPFLVHSYVRVSSAAASSALGGW